MSEVKRTVTFNAPIEEVFKVITDFETYPEFLEETKDVIIDKKTKKEVIASFTLQLMAKIQYTLKLALLKPTSVKWELVKGQMMKHNSGSWKLKKLSPKKTQATYTIDVGFGPLVPKSISNVLIDNNLPTMLESFKERIES